MENSGNDYNWMNICYYFTVFYLTLYIIENQSVTSYDTCYNMTS